MQDNKNENQNSDSLFTQMFGVASEQPEEITPTTPQSNPMEEVKEPKEPSESSTPVETQQVIKSEQTTPVDNGLSSLNNSSSGQTSSVTIIEEPGEIIELSTKKVEEPPVENNQNKIHPIYKNNQAPLNQGNYIPIGDNGQMPINQNNPNNQQLNTMNAPSFQNDLNFSYQQTNANTPQSEKGPNPIIGLVLIFGLILAFGGLGAFLVQNLNDKTQEEFEKQTSTEEKEKEEENKKEEEQPGESSKEEVYITFTPDLKFDKGLVNNPAEIHQRSPYVPTAKNGVIKCNNTKTLDADSVKMNDVLYFQYDNYKLKKLISVSELIYSNNNLYNQAVASCKSIKASVGDRESMSFDCVTNSESRYVRAILFENLAYGSNFRLEGTNTMLYSTFDYDDEIKSVMGQAIYNEIYGNNMECSSVKLSSQEDDNV